MGRSAKADDAPAVEKSAPVPARSREVPVESGPPIIAARAPGGEPMGPAPSRPRDLRESRRLVHRALRLRRASTPIEDSTQSFEDGIQPNLIQRAGTYRAITAGRSSRRATRVSACSSERRLPGHQIPRAQIELDFYARADGRAAPTTASCSVRCASASLTSSSSRRSSTSSAGILRPLRLEQLLLPATVGYLGVPPRFITRSAASYRKRSSSSETSRSWPPSRRGRPA